MSAEPMTTIRRNLRAAQDATDEAQHDVMACIRDRREHGETPSIVAALAHSQRRLEIASAAEDRAAAAFSRACR